MWLRQVVCDASALSVIKATDAAILLPVWLQDLSLAGDQKVCNHAAGKLHQGTSAEGYCSYLFSFQGTA